MDTLQRVKIMELALVSTSYAVAGILALLFFFYALFAVFPRFVAPRKRLPPEAAGAWPLIGHLHLLTGTEPAHITFAKMADAYGPIFMLKFGMYRTLIVSSWEIARECFTTNDRVFASRPKLKAGKLLGYDYAMFGMSPYGSHWRHVRRVVAHELFTNHRLEQFQEIRTSEVKCSIKKLYELWVESRNKAHEKVLVEMKTWFSDIALNTIFRVVVGKGFSSAFDDNGDEQYRKALRDFVELLGVFVPSDAFPFLSWLDLGGYEKAMRKTSKVLDKLFDKLLKEHRQKTNSGEAEREEQDFMDVMLSTFKDDGELSGYDSDTVTKATCLAMILAGSDTVTVTMIWAISLLLNNQEALRKVQVELDTQVGRERQVKESDVKNLSYLQAIVTETLRLYPAAPLLIPHESMEDCRVAGYHIPAGTRLMINLQKLQRDPLVWKNPCEFRPERFLTSHKDFDVRGQNPQLIPFGNGRRICLGISFAQQIMHLTLANLLHGFEIGRPSEELLDREESIGLTSIKTSPLEVVLTPRLPTHVYE